MHRMLRSRPSALVAWSAFLALVAMAVAVFLAWSVFLALVAMMAGAGGATVH